MFLHSLWTVLAGREIPQVKLHGRNRENAGIPRSNDPLKERSQEVVSEPVGLLRVKQE